MAKIKNLEANFCIKFEPFLKDPSQDLKPCRTCMLNRQMKKIDF